MGTPQTKRTLQMATHIPRLQRAEKQINNNLERLTQTSTKAVKDLKHSTGSNE